MKELLPESLLRLAKEMPEPLYVVGGFVRDFLSGRTCAEPDLDICSPTDADSFVAAAERCGLTPVAVYRHTGTVKLKDGENHAFEYTCFRSDRYVRGTHVPVEIFFTDDIALDAKRRDFTANAVYYDIGGEKFVDPLGGRKDIAERRLRTVDAAEKVFGEDGLRLMRLARQAGQLGFTPDGECLAGAAENAALILDISPERIFAELTLLLRADRKYGVKDGHYAGLKILDRTGVLDRILPELTAGRGMEQRKDFHSYDILEHSLRAARYADERVRLAALLHDAGKPFCMLRDGNVHAHPEEGARIAGEILARLKAPVHASEQIRALILWHMYDFDGRTKPGKLRRFFVRNAPLLEELMLLKQADFSGCKDDLSPCPTNIKWRAELARMQAEGAPLRLKELAVSGKDLLEADAPPRLISRVLRAMLLHAAVCPADNAKSRLLALLPSFVKTAEEEQLREQVNGQTNDNADKQAGEPVNKKQNG